MTHRTRRTAWACRHTDEPHYARGRCRRCYRQWSEARKTCVPPDGVQLRQASARAAWDLTRPIVQSVPQKRLQSRHRRTAWVCAHTNRPHIARGLCRSCYNRWNRLRRHSGSIRVLYGRDGVPLKCGHPYNPRARGGRGLCFACYQRAVRHDRRERSSTL